MQKLSIFNSTVIPPGNLPVDPKGDPKFWNYTWNNFADYEETEIVNDV